MRPETKPFNALEIFDHSGCLHIRCRGGVREIRGRNDRLYAVGRYEMTSVASIGDS